MKKQVQIFVIILFSLTSCSPEYRLKQHYKYLDKIPSNIDQSINMLDNVLDKSAKEVCARIETNVDLEDFNNKYSKKIQDLWLLNSTVSPLTRYFLYNNVTVPLDITKIIFTSYHRKLLSQPIDFYSQLREYYSKEDIVPYPKLPVARFEVGDSLLYWESTREYFIDKIGFRRSYKLPLYCLILKVKDKDTTHNKLELYVFKITRKYNGVVEELSNHTFGNENYTINSFYWVDATWCRKNGETMAADVL